MRVYLIKLASLRSSIITIVDNDESIIKEVILNTEKE